MEVIREIIFYKHYFDEFFESLNEKIKNKIDEVQWVSEENSKAPKKEIEKAIRIMKEYFEEQKNKDNGNKK